MTFNLGKQVIKFSGWNEFVKLTESNLLKRYSSELAHYIVLSVSRCNNEELDVESKNY